MMKGRVAGVRSLAVLLVGAVVICSSAGAALAQGAWPTRAVKIIIPFAAGGGTDIAARHLQPLLAEQLGQPIVIENRGGSGGVVGTEALVRSAPDGHTIGMIVSSHASNPALYKTLPYDAVRDIKPVTVLFRAANVWGVHPAAPYQTLADVLAAAKAAPGKVAVVTSGTGTAQHLGFEQLKLATGTDMIHVPYRGAGPALNDLLIGQVQIGILNISSMLPNIQGERVRALAVTSAERSNFLPDVPSVAETLPGFDSVEWFAFATPAGVADEIVAKLHGAIVRAAQTPQYGERAKQMGVDLVLNTPSELKALIAADIAKFAELIVKADIKLD